MATKKKPDEVSTEPKKRKRVAFTEIDPGIEANGCINIFLVRSQDEVGAESSVRVDPVDLNHFFGEDGKIYGYKNLKIDAWVNTVTFHAYADITYETTFDGGKGITDLKLALQNIFGESLLEKEEFLNKFTETQYIRSIIAEGKCIPHDSSRVHENSSDISEACLSKVVRMDLQNMPVGFLYSRLIPLVLLLVEGSSPIDVTDPRWEILLIVKEMPDMLGDTYTQLLGFATVYRFYHYPDSTRLRISQILVLPSCQGQGYGRRLLDAVNYIAVSDNAYDVTVEEPSDYFQSLRVCVDTLRLLELPVIEPAIKLVISYLKEGNLSKRTSKFQFRPSGNIIDIVREKLKINRKQFLQCWEVLIYMKLQSDDPKCLTNFRICLSDRVRSEIFEKDAANNDKRLVEVPNNYDHDMTFVVFRSEDGTETNGLDGKVEADLKTQDQQLNELIDKEMDDITEIATKISHLQKQHGFC